MSLLKDFKDQLASLKTELTNLVASKASSEATAGFQTKLSALETSVASELATAATAISDRDTKIVSLTADLAAANASLTAKDVAATAAAAALVTEAQRTDETLAALGVDPKIIPAPAAPAATAKTMTRAAFQALTPSEKSSYCRNGGKLTE